MIDQSKPLSPDHTWEQGWDGHQREQQLRLASLSFAEKLAWLEEAQNVVLHLQKSVRAADDTASPGK